MDMTAKELSGPYEQQASTVRALQDQINKFQDQKERVTQAYEVGAYSVTDFTGQMESLRCSEDELAKKKADVERDLGQQTTVITSPQMVLDFARDIGEFTKTIQVHPEDSRSYSASRSCGTRINPRTQILSWVPTGVQFPPLTF